MSQRTPLQGTKIKEVIALILFILVLLLAVFSCSSPRVMQVDHFPYEFDRTPTQCECFEPEF